MPLVKNSNNSSLKPQKAAIANSLSKKSEDKKNFRSTERVGI